MTDDTLPSRFEAARVLLNSGKQDEAEEACVALRNDFPDHFSVLHLSGMVAKAQGQHQDACTYLRQALALKDTHHQTHLVYAQSLFALNEFREAESAVQRSIELKDDEADALFLLYKLHKAQSRGKEAMAAMEKAVSLKPSDFLYRIEKIQMLRHLGLREQAVDDVLSLVETHPDNVVVYQNLAWAQTLSDDDPNIPRMEKLAANRLLKKWLVRL